METGWFRTGIPDDEAPAGRGGLFALPGFAVPFCVHQSPVSLAGFLMPLIRLAVLLVTARPVNTTFCGLRVAGATADC
jgi:hypothetical protein